MAPMTAMPPAPTARSSGTRSAVIPPMATHGVPGGALAASMLSAMPAWRLIDPLPVLARVDDEDDDEEAAQEDDQAVAPFLWEPEGDKLA